MKGTLPLISAIKVLVVDDEEVYAENLAEWLRECGHAPHVETTASGGLARLQEEAFDVILLDMVMPGMDGLGFIRGLNADDHPEVIVLSGSISVRSAVEAMKLGAFDCVPKTEDPETLDILVRNAAEAGRRERDLRLLSRRIEHQSLGPEFIAASPRMREILDVLGNVAVSKVSVLLTGESGTGKDLLARTIHGLSPRSSGPFVDVNCAALSESLLETELFGHEKGAFTGAIVTKPGLVEAAHGGTLLLDEVIEMPPPLQAKLLRMTEDRTLYRVGGRQRIHVDVRIVAATNRELPKEIAAGRLREDLYYRLAGVEILVPPLRERPEDVAPLCEHYLRHAVRQAGRGPQTLSPQALAALRVYRWPGNVRELRNLMERMALLVRAARVEAHHLPADVLLAPKGPSPRGSLREIERSQIQLVLDEEGWHHGRAAARLGLAVRTLYRKIKSYQLARGESTRKP